MKKIINSDKFVLWWSEHTSQIVAIICTVVWTNSIIYLLMEFTTPIRAIAPWMISWFSWWAILCATIGLNVCMLGFIFSNCAFKVEMNTIDKNLERVRNS